MKLREYPVAPATFQLPPDEERKNLHVGDYVKLTFVDTSAERMWVKVTKIASPGVYRGELMNTPIAVSLTKGTPVVFSWQHVIDISDEDTPSGFEELLAYCKNTARWVVNIDRGSNPLTDSPPFLEAKRHIMSAVELSAWDKMDGHQAEILKELDAALRSFPTDVLKSEQDKLNPDEQNPADLAVDPDVTAMFSALFKSVTDSSSLNLYMIMHPPAAECGLLDSAFYRLLSPEDKKHAEAVWNARGHAAGKS
jgi:hypothetical protein